MYLSHVRSRSPVLLLWAACLVLPARAADWPQWRGPDRTGQVTAGTPVPTSLPSEPKVIWRIGIGAGLASPVVAGGKVFYFDNQQGKETLHAIDAVDAKEVWRMAVDDTFADQQGPSGPRCTPLVDEDCVYVQSGTGELQCLSRAEGRRLWRASFTNDFGAVFFGEDTPIPGAAEHGYTAAPVIAGQKLIACAGGTNGAGIVCFDKHTGKVLWKSQNDRAAYAAPMISTLAGVKQAVCFTVEGLLGVALEDGALLWRVPIKAPYGRNCTTPIVVEDWVVVASYRAGLIGVKVTSAGGRLTAERAWVNKDLPMNFSSPVRVGRHIFGLGPNRRIVCAALEDGHLAWAKSGYVTTTAELAHASFLVMGENILINTDAGDLFLIAGDPSDCRELGRATKVCGPNWCNPAYADGRLYLRDGLGLKATGSLYCMELMTQ